MKHLFSFLIALTFCLGSHINAQNTFYANYDPSPGNQVYFGGFKRILPISGNNYIVMSGTYEKVIARMNANMEIVWSQKLDLPGTQTSYGVYDVTISNDNKILILGFGGGGAYHSFVVKMDLNGNVIWKKDVKSNHGICGYYLAGKQILNAYDNGFLIVGSNSEGQSMLLRMDEDGDAVWAKIFDDVDDTGNTRFNNGVHIGNNQYMFQASMRSMSFFVIDDNGNLVSKMHHDDNNAYTYPKYLKQSNAGDFFSVGYTRETVNNDRRQVLAKVNSAGNLVWCKEIKVDSTFDMHEPYALEILPNGELVILGYFSNQGATGRRIQFTRFDQAGNHLGTTVGWDAGTEYVYGGTYEAGSMLLAGISLHTRNVIARVDLTGAGICNGGPVPMSTRDMMPDFAAPNDQVTLATMPTTITDATFDIVPYTYTRTVVCGTTVVATDPGADQAWKVAPQPAQGAFRLHHPAMNSGQIRLFDLSGRLIYQTPINPNATETEISDQNLPAGMYLLQADGDGGAFSRQVAVY